MIKITCPKVIASEKYNIHFFAFQSKRNFFFLQRLPPDYFSTNAFDTWLEVIINAKKLNRFYKQYHISLFVKWYSFLGWWRHKHLQKSTELRKMKNSIFLQEKDPKSKSNKTTTTTTIQSSSTTATTTSAITRRANACCYTFSGRSCFTNLTTTWGNNPIK